MVFSSEYTAIKWYRIEFSDIASKLNGIQVSLIKFNAIDN